MFKLNSFLKSCRHERTTPLSKIDTHRQKNSRINFHKFLFILKISRIGEKSYVTTIFLHKTEAKLLGYWNLGSGLRVHISSGSPVFEMLGSRDDI